MQKFIIGLLTIMIVFGLLNTPVTADIGDRVFLGKYNVIEEVWTNMTITGDHFVVHSDDALRDGLEGDFLVSPWDQIEIKLKDGTFFTTEHNEENPHTIVEISWNGQTNRHSINQADINPDGIIGLLEGMMDQLTGLSLDESVWPIDMSVAIAESYPEQYQVSSSIIRGYDLLDYVVEIDIALIVTDYDIFSLYFDLVDPQITYIAKNSIELNHGGQYSSISFNTFSLGKGISPSSLYYVVLLENGMYLQTPNDFGLVKVGFTQKSFEAFVFHVNETRAFQTRTSEPTSNQTSDTITDDTIGNDKLIVESEDELKLPFDSFFWFSLILVSVFRKKVN